MSESENMMEAYIQTLLKIQEEQKERPLDEQEMKRIAYDLGMDDEDIANIPKKINDFIARGKGYSRYEDWESAIEEFSQAVALSPTNLDALFGLANSYRNRWLLKGYKDDLNKAKHYVKRALQVNPHHDSSFKLASELNKGNSKLRTTDPIGQLRGINKELEKLKESINAQDLLSTEALKFEGSGRLKKSSRDKKIFGVCGGIAEYFGIDPTWLRVAFIIGTFLGGGFPIPLYIILAFVLPKN